MCVQFTIVDSSSRLETGPAIIVYAVQWVVEVARVCDLDHCVPFGIRAHQSALIGCNEVEGI